MAGKKDYAITTTITGLTGNQAADLASAIQKDKNKIAPSSRGTFFSGKAENIRKYLSNGEVPKIEQGKK